MNHSITRAARRLLSVPFAAGLAVGVLATGTSAALLGSSVFPDVPAGSYYDRAVGELNAAGIIKGSNGKFMPEKPVTRAEVAVMLARLRAELNGEVWDDGTSGGTTTSRSRSSSSKSSSVSSSSSSSSVSSAWNPKGSFRFTSATQSVGENLGKITIGVVRTGGNEGSAAINYTVTSGTAIAGTDFVVASGTVVLSSKETSKTFQINITDDTLSEGDETFTVTLSNPQYGVGLTTPNTMTVSIKDNETGGGSSNSANSSSSVSSGPAAGTFNFAATAFAVKENGGSITVTVNRLGGSQGSVNVNYTTTNGTAKSGQDFNGATGTLSFGAGETTKTFSVAALDNSSITGNKAFTVTLSAPTGGAALGDVKDATVTIFDDESGEFGSGALKFSKSTYDVQQSAGKLVVTVMRTGGAQGQISVDYFTSNGSAFAGNDYTSTSGTLTFLAGEASKTFTVPILKNSTSTGERAFNVGLSNNTSTTTLVTPYNATVNIYK
jgi:Calx-beta domain/S-layer homology domain